MTTECCSRPQNMSQNQSNFDARNFVLRGTDASEPSVAAALNLEGDQGTALTAGSQAGGLRAAADPEEIAAL